MNQIQSAILLLVIGGMMAYSYRCIAALRRLLVSHGMHPAPIWWNTAILSYSKLVKQLKTELTDQDEIKALRSALSKADISIVVTGVVFFALVSLFVGR